jgi:hypothetical protein
MTKIVEVSEVNITKGMIAGVYYQSESGERYEPYGCSTLCILNLKELLDKKTQSNLAELEQIKKEIKECEELQSARFPDIYNYLNKELYDLKMDEGLTIDILPRDLLRKIFTGSIFVCGLEMQINPEGLAHTALIYAKDKRLYLDCRVSRNGYHLILT